MIYTTHLSHTLITWSLFWDAMPGHSRIFYGKGYAMNNQFLFDIDQMIVILPILILLCLSAVFLIIRASKPKEKRKKLILSLLPGILAVVIATAVGIAFYSAW